MRNVFPIFTPLSCARVRAFELESEGDERASHASEKTYLFNYLQVEFNVLFMGARTSCLCAIMELVM